MGIDEGGRRRYISGAPTSGSKQTALSAKGRIRGGIGVLLAQSGKLGIRWETRTDDRRQ